MQMKDELDARKKRVLQAIVDDYIESAEPVGSRTDVYKRQEQQNPWGASNRSFFAWGCRHFLDFFRISGDNKT